MAEEDVWQDTDIDVWEDTVTDVWQDIDVAAVTVGVTKTRVGLLLGVYP